MSIRTRILLTALAAALVPFVLLAFAIRREAGSRLAEIDAAEARSAAARIEDGIEASSARIDRSLRAIATWIREDAELRRSLESVARDSNDPRTTDNGDPRTTDNGVLPAEDPSARSDRVRGFATSAMNLSGLSFLELLDARGRIVSSGQFRQDHGRIDASMLQIPAGAIALVEVRHPEGMVQRLARRHAFSLAGLEYTLVGGLAPDEVLPWSPPAVSIDAGGEAAGAGAAHSDREVLVTLVGPGGETPPEALRTRAIAYLPPDARRPELANLVFLRGDDPTAGLRERLDAWLAGVLAASLVASFALASLLAEYVSRPIRALAEKTTHVQLRPSRIDLDSNRPDEVGELSRFMASMVERLRTSAQQLQDAERRAALGDLARQVNHDVRGGVAPIRHVVRHLSSLADGDPAELSSVYRDRRRTLEASLLYLEDLATRYAKLSPRPELRSVDLHAVIEQVLAATPIPAGARLALEGASGPAWVGADALALRRIVENLVRNALEALPEGRGEVILTAAASATDSTIALRVRDTGRGIPESDRERVFEPFFSTRERGTGLGLGIVRRLVMDCEGRLDLASEPGSGTTVTVMLARAEPHSTSATPDTNSAVPEKSSATLDTNIAVPETNAAAPDANSYDTKRVAPDTERASS